MMTTNKVTLFADASKGGQKRWSIWIEPDNTTVTVEWGVVGGRMQTSSDTAKPKGKPGTKSYKDEATCAMENYERQIRKKREEGYLAEGEVAAEADYLTALDKNFVPAKPLQKMEQDKLDKLDKDERLWIQRKRDGRRHLALKTRTGDVRIYSRRMEDLTDHFPVFVARIKNDKRIPNGSIFDGEIIVDDANKDNFRVTGTFTNPATKAEKAIAAQEGLDVRFMLFDVLYYKGNPCWALPYSERYEILTDLFGDAPEESSGIIYRAPVLNMTLKSAQELALRAKWEGLVLWVHDEGSFVRIGGKPKRVNAIKWKPIQEGDFVATGYYLGSGELSDVTGGLNIGEYAPDGTWRSCGNVGTGFDAAMRKEIMTWTFPCVVEVKYDSQEPTGKLRFPVFVRKRDDKGVEECIGAELDSEE